MNINPGELTKRISIISRESVRDADGYASAPVETVVHECWARFTRTSGAEIQQANADFEQVKARFLIRYTAKPLDRRMIVRYSGDDYEILYLNEYGDDREYIELWCERLTLEG